MLGPLLSLAERGRLPDTAIRFGIRRLLAERLRSLPAEGSEAARTEFQRFLAACAREPVAVVPERANEQHYEVPARFFEYALGPRLKYSCCHFANPHDSLAVAEESALRITCDRAGLADGQEILELGCGWGSLTLWMAARFPHARITAVSNSHRQREFIRTRAREQSLENVRVVTADMNTFDPGRAESTSATFDRVVSVEMFEHMRNHRELLRRIAGWLRPQGRLFVHIFCHRSQPYLFEETGPSDWMTRYFFAGGMMPSDHLLAHCQDDLTWLDQWRWSGEHYERTANAWLSTMDAQRERITPLLQAAYGADAEIWRQRWRMFFMACAELFGYRQGREWFVSHYLFGRRR